MLSHFFSGRHDPFDFMSRQLDDIFGQFEEESLWQPPRRSYNDFDDDLWGYDPYVNQPRGRSRRLGGYGGLGGLGELGDEMRYLASSMSRQMREMQRAFDNIEARIASNPALEDLNLDKETQKGICNDLTKEEKSKDTNLSTQPNTQRSENTKSHTNPIEREPRYKIIKTEKHYVGGSDPSKRSYFMKTEVNDNGHVKVKTAEKKAGEDWRVDTKEYDQPLTHALKSEQGQDNPQQQIKNEEPQRESIKSETAHNRQQQQEQQSIRSSPGSTRKSNESAEKPKNPVC